MGVATKSGSASTVLQHTDRHLGSGRNDVDAPSRHLIGFGRNRCRSLHGAVERSVAVAVHQRARSSRRRDRRDWPGADALVDRCRCSPRSGHRHSTSDLTGQLVSRCCSAVVQFDRCDARPPTACSRSSCFRNDSIDSYESLGSLRQS